MLEIYSNSRIYTIGHSTRSIDEFIEILKHFNINIVIDVRKIPESKKFPHFNKDFLKDRLKENNIQYIHYPELGGFRLEGYENFSKSNEFKNAVDKLIKIIKNKNTTILCAEIDYRRCHRFFISNALEQRGFEVIHIWNKEKIEKHDRNAKLTLFCDKKAKKLQNKNQII
ncbi:MAG: DUF488 domain-containing protein [Candidatus Aenigmatarchaeota archaeon]